MMCAGCREKNEIIRQLRAELYGDDRWEPPRELALTHMERTILRYLVSTDRPRAKWYLLEVTRGGAGTKNGTTENTIDAKICHLRRKLKPFGLVIETLWGEGYRLTPSARMALLNWPGGKQEAA